MQETWETWVQSPSQEDPLKEENGNPLQYSCLEDPMDTGAWWAKSMGSQRVGPTKHILITHGGYICHSCISSDEIALQNFFLHSFLIKILIFYY